MSRAGLSKRSPAPRREVGQGLVEYALILALVAILIMASLIALEDQISTTFSTIVSAIS